MCKDYACDYLYAYLQPTVNALHVCIRAVQTEPGWSDLGSDTEPAREHMRVCVCVCVCAVGGLDRLPRDRVSQATGSPPLSPAKLQPHIPQPTFVLGR